MFNTPDHVTNVSHHLVSAMYKKMDFSQDRSENVLVIETMFPDEDEDGHTFDFYLMDLLSDLGDLKHQAEGCVGKIDRIDIRSHH
ncbi:MAG TPA: hypothetical protein PLO23_00925 [Alphaproteobacteria bacterium]|nr:hypothetical protein [Alphaproteobacteria bacterium]